MQIMSQENDSSLAFKVTATTASYMNSLNNFSNELLFQKQNIYKDLATYSMYIFEK